MRFIRRIFAACFLSVMCGAGANGATCSANQYLLNDACVSCIYNATCNGATFTCNDGFYDTGANECAACPPNSICTSPAEFTCVAGTFLYNGVCTACPQNATCVGGDADFHCNPEYYRSGQFCMSCDGHTCDGEKLVSCGAGYFYYNWNGIYCMECNDTMYCPAGTTIASVMCIEGYYKTGYRCFECPNEYYCPDNIATIDNYKQYCAPGYYQNGGECVACPDGGVCPGHKSGTCPDGLFWHDNGQCLSYAPGDPGVAPNCNPGFYDNGGVCDACPVENSTCRSATDFDCFDGFYKNGTACDVCPAYSTCPAGSAQISCIPGYWLDGAICNRCPEAYYCNNNTKYPCPEFDPASLDAVLPAGHKLVDYDDKITCGSETGVYSQISNCRLGNHLTIETPEGFYVKYAPFWNGQQYWNNYVFWTHTETPGRYLASSIRYGNEIYYNNNNACTNASEHAIYTGAGSPDGNDCPWRCDDGYFRDGDVCTVCPAGLVCRDGKIVCPIGQYASGAACLDCPAHYGDRAAENTAPQSINECQIRCNAGMYLATAGATECANVGAGFWNAENYTNYGSAGVRNKCSDNLTTVGYGAGADSANDCGKILHIGNYTLYLRSGKLTSPSLAVQVGDRVLYGDTSRETRGHLRVEYKGATYSVFNSDID